MHNFTLSVVTRSTTEASIGHVERQRKNREGAAVPGK
jgi:hypothetical protein